MLLIRHSSIPNKQKQYNRKSNGHFFSIVFDFHSNCVPNSICSNLFCIVERQLRHWRSFFDGWMNEWNSPHREKRSNWYLIQNASLLFRSNVSKIKKCSVLFLRRSKSNNKKRRWICHDSDRRWRSFAMAKHFFLKNHSHDTQEPVSRCDTWMSIIVHFDSGFAIGRCMNHLHWPHSTQLRLLKWW